MKILFDAARVCALVLMCAASASAATIPVAAGGDLQQAINRALPGDTIALAPGATFTGNFTLPAKSGGAVISVHISKVIQAGMPAGSPPAK